MEGRVSPAGVPAHSAMLTVEMYAGTLGQPEAGQNACCVVFLNSKTQ